MNRTFGLLGKYLACLKEKCKLTSIKPSDIDYKPVA